MLELKDIKKRAFVALKYLQMRLLYMLAKVYNWSSRIILAFPIHLIPVLFTWIPYFGCLFLDSGGVTDI